uniref:Patatin-like phospholipase domain containing 3 n=1 Tax=Gadus morhua TaxID=8049 RepID=A0A8C5FLA1_GADMO
MFDLSEGWNLSFAGCGFLGIYHIGVASCLLEKAPHLVQGASNIYGASAGALTAAVLAIKCCEDVISVAKEARKRNLGPLHPSFNLVKVLKAGLERDLPADAHLRVAGRLSVSLTRVADGENVLVSDFNSKEELIQALVCSCFIPIYCGIIPPFFRGVRYVDGGISDNLPQSELKNTISILPVLRRRATSARGDKSSSFHELRFTNTSIQMNLGNAYRLSRVLAETCQSGYQDALRFLENHTQAPPPPMPRPPCCCDNAETRSEWVLRRLRLLQKQHWCIITRSAPCVSVFCEACQSNPGIYAQVSEMLPVRVASFMLLPYTLPVHSALSVAQRFMEWIPEVPTDMRWLYGVAGDVYRQAWKGMPATSMSAPTLRQCQPDDLPPPLDIGAPPPALSTQDLHSTYWDTQNPLLSATSPDTAPDTAPQEVCFFLGSQEEVPQVDP